MENNMDLGIKLTESLSYWEKRRLHFNIIVGAAGLTGMLLFIFPRWGILPYDVFGAICWGIMANVLYSLGYVLESIALKLNVLNTANLRNLFFIGGTVAYALVSFLASFWYTFALAD